MFELLLCVLELDWSRKLNRFLDIFKVPKRNLNIYTTLGPKRKLEIVYWVNQWDEWGLFF